MGVEVSAACDGGSRDAAACVGEMMGNIEQFLQKNQLVLMEASVVEQLRRSGEVHLHKTLANAPLIYEEAGRAALNKIYQSYIDIAVEADLPILLCAPTWRGSWSRVCDANIQQGINIDAARYMQKLRDAQTEDGVAIKIGGMIGCKNDCYRPDEGLSAAEGRRFHTWQVEQLVQGGVDFLIAATLPNVKEALGIARAMEGTGLPYVISFVISRDGRVLDGCSLSDAVELIDTNVEHRPLGYMVNCAHPSFLCPEEQPAALFDRLIGYQANASSLDHCDLDEAGQLEVDDVAEWGDLMLALNRRYGVQILGGCCGTNGDHLQYVASGGETCRG